jgi:trigger factor
VEVNVERVGPVELRLTFEVSAAECDRELGSAYKAYAARKRLPGFRPGKVPVRRIKREAESLVVHQVSEAIIDRAYREAVQENELQPVLPPQVEGHPHCHESEPFVFAITVEVRPEIELKQVKMGVTVERRAVSAEEMPKELERLRLSAAKISTAEEGAEATVEHQIGVIFSAWHGDDQVADGEERSFYLGSDDLEPGIRDALLGATVGPTVEAEIVFSADNENGDLAGETVRHSFEVKTLENVRLPELDDAFAKEVGPGFDDLDALRTAIQERLEAMADEHQERSFEDAVIDKLILANPFEVPMGLVNRQLEVGLQRAFQGLRPDQLDAMGIDLEAFRGEMRPKAMRTVQAGLLLEEIAEAEDLTPQPQQIAQEMVHIAKQTNKPLAEVQQSLSDPAVVEQVVADLRHRMALAFVVDAAKGQNEEEG